MENSKDKFFTSLTVLAMAATVLVIAMVATEIKGYRYIGGGVTATNTISVSGDGEVLASPDIATLTFTIQGEGKDASSAQEVVSNRTKTTLAAIKKVGIPDNDIKTENYSSYPKYEWQRDTIVCIAAPCIQPAGRQVIVGYEVSESISVTVRNLDLVNAVTQALGQANVSNMYGPNFTIDKQDDLQALARKEAIDKARTKAEALARDLGVSLVRVVSFSEGGVYPMYAAKAMGMGGAVTEASAPAPELPQGQTKITANVTVTYEIQ